MRTRLVVGLTLAAGIIAALLVDGYLSGPGVGGRAISVSPPSDWVRHGAISTLVVLLLTLAATHELVVLARARGYKPFGKLALLFTAILVLGPYLSFHLARGDSSHGDSWGLLVMACAVAITFVVQVVRHRTESAMENLATTLFIIFYAGCLASFMTRLRMEIGGTTGVLVLLFSMFIVKMTDTGAYFVGKALGRHKMIEWLSPKKTWEGFAGGMATAVAVSVGLGLWLHEAEVTRLAPHALHPVASFALLGLLLGVFSVAGDLCASLLKRDARVKDSGHAFPGLGGVLDVFDSPLLAAPVAWLFWTRLFPLDGA